MTATNETTVDSASLRALQDRTDIADVLYKYSSAVDSFDYDGVRSALADDIWAQYGNGDPVEGGDKLAGWIAEATATVIWQHHLLNVYHITIDGDQAKTLSYLTSYQVFKENPDAADHPRRQVPRRTAAHAGRMEDQQADHGAAVGRVEGR